jgi:hypothetical protein
MNYKDNGMSEMQDTQRKPNPTHTQITVCVQECIWLFIYIIYPYNIYHD